MRRQRRSRGSTLGRCTFPHSRAYLLIPELLGHCSLDGRLGRADLSCVGSLAARDAVLDVLDTLPGDLNADGAVALKDFLILSKNYGKNTASYAEGTIDQSGPVTFRDFLTLARNFGGWPSQVSAVPKPRSSALLVLASLRVLWRRRVCRPHTQDLAPSPRLGIPS